MEPVIFQPIYKERVWGGRSLETIYKRTLPCDATPFGESWEMTDRVKEQSVVIDGKFKGLSLNTLWNEHQTEIFGPGMPDTDRFPLLIKILDAHADLSVQVHPPEHIAQKLGGEAKTEMWYIADVEPEGTLYVGVKEGVTSQCFEKAIINGTVEEHIHSIHPKVGDSIHIESGRLHAIGSGFLIYEIQQNSDTTYRVFDWNRLGLNGQPRDLHIKESMMCIDFSDQEPSMDHCPTSTISQCVHFQVDKYHAHTSDQITQKNIHNFAIITVISGIFASANGHRFTAGDFFLLPANASPLVVIDEGEYLETIIPV